MKHLFILFCLLILCPLLLIGQTFTSTVSGTDATLSVSGAYDSTLMFILYGDGYFSMGEGSSLSRQHRYPATSQTYTPEVWLARKKHTSPPAKITQTVTTGSTTGTFTNPTVAMTGNIKLGTSWLPVAGVKNANIITFTNTCDKRASGKLKFYYDSNQELGVDDVRMYNGWVYNMTMSGSDDPSYDKMVTWDYSALNPGEQRHVYLFCRTKTSVAENTAVNTKAVITSDVCDNPSETATLSLQSNKYPHDPNQKKVFPKTICAYDNPFLLNYYISFYNDGETFANDVQVFDKFDAQLDFPSLNFTASNHDCFPTPMGGSEMNFKFPGIMLPGINQTSPYQYTYDEATAWFTFDIKTLPCLRPGAILNQADVYFDGLAPVQTDVAKTVVEFDEKCPNYCHGQRSEQQIAPSFEVKPNPFSERLYIRIPAAENAEKTQLQVLDARGRVLVQEMLEQGSELSISSAAWPAGVYIVRQLTGTETRTTKVVKN